MYPTIFVFFPCRKRRTSVLAQMQSYKNASFPFLLRNKKKFQQVLWCLLVHVDLSTRATPTLCFPSCRRSEPPSGCLLFGEETGNMIDGPGFNPIRVKDRKRLGRKSPLHRTHNLLSTLLYSLSLLKSILFFLYLPNIIISLRSVEFYSFDFHNVSGCVWKLLFSFPRPSRNERPDDWQTTGFFFAFNGRP